MTIDEFQVLSLYCCILVNVYTDRKNFWEIYPYKRYTYIFLGETAGLEMNFSYNYFATKVRQLRLFECRRYAQETALQFYLHRWDCPKRCDLCQSVNLKTFSDHIEDYLNFFFIDSNWFRIEF